MAIRKENKRTRAGMKEKQGMVKQKGAAETAFEKKILEFKPDVQMDENFGKRLKNELMTEFSKREYKEQNERSGLFSLLRGPIAGLAGAMALVAIVGVTLFINRDIFLQKKPAVIEEQLAYDNKTEFMPGKERTEMKKENGKEEPLPSESESVAQGGQLKDEKGPAPESRTAPDDRFNAPSPVPEREQDEVRSLSMDKASEEYSGAKLKRSIATAAKEDAAEKKDMRVIRAISGSASNYVLLKAAIDQGKMPSPSLIKIDELVNSFSYRYALPDAGKTFSIVTEIGICPWNVKRYLICVGLNTAPGVKGKAVARNAVLNLNFDPNLIGDVQAVGGGQTLALYRSAGKAGFLTGDIYSGDQATLLLEFTANEPISAGTDIMNGTLSYRIPGEPTGRELPFSVKVPSSSAKTSGNFRFASAVAWWGMALSQRISADQNDLQRIIGQAEAAGKGDPQKTEFVNTARTSRSLMIK